VFARKDSSYIMILSPASKYTHVTRRRSLAVTTSVTRRVMLHTAHVRRDSNSKLIRRTAPRFTSATRRRKEDVTNIVTNMETNTSVAATKDLHWEKMERLVKNRWWVHVRRRMVAAVNCVTLTTNWVPKHVVVPRRVSS
jgi:hypothetical protein